MLLHNSRKPRFNWDSETELARKLGMINIVAIVVGVVMLVFLLFSTVIVPALDNPKIIKITVTIYAAAALIIIVLSYAVNSFCVKAASKNLMKLENV